MKFKEAKILICDDSILARKQLKDVLISCDADDILEASNGQEAVELYQKHHPDIVFLDIVMPIKDGHAALSEIKEINPDADIVVVSSVGTQEQLRKAIELGARDFIQKPFNDRQIKTILNTRFEGGA